MRSTNIFLILSGLFILSCLAAGAYSSETADACNYTRDSFKFSEPKNPNIINTYWQHTKNAESEEYVDRLSIAYKNGDAVIIEHQYCSMYNFKASYFSTRSGDIKSIKNLDALLQQLQNLNAVAIKLSVIPNERIIPKLKKSSFDPEKPYEVNFDESDKAGKNNVSYSFSYDPLGSFGMLGTMVLLYVGYGGNDS